MSASHSPSRWPAGVSTRNGSFCGARTVRSFRLHSLGGCMVEQLPQRGTVAHADHRSPRCRAVHGSPPGSRRLASRRRRSMLAMSEPTGTVSSSIASTAWRPWWGVVSSPGPQSFPGGPGRRVMTRRWGCASELVEVVQVDLHQPRPYPVAGEQAGRDPAADAAGGDVGVVGGALDGREPFGAGRCAASHGGTPDMPKGMSRRTDRDSPGRRVPSGVQSRPSGRVLAAAGLNTRTRNCAKIVYRVGPWAGVSLPDCHGVATRGLPWV